MLTDKQLEFCKQVSLGKSGSEAYSIAFKSKNEGSSKVSASRLLKSQEIKDEIKRLQEENRAIALATKTEAAKQLAPNSIADVAERMQVLTQIMRGEIPLKKPMVCDGVIELIDVVPDWMDRKAAIAELNKMGGDYAPAKTDITSGGKELRQSVIINTTPEIAKNIEGL